MASSRFKVICILYFFAVTSVVNIAGYIIGFHRKPGEKIQGIELVYIMETSFNLISDVAMLHTLYRPPRNLAVLLNRMKMFLSWNTGSTIICVGSRLLGCHLACSKAKVDLESIPYNRDTATHRKILFMSCAFQCAIIFIFKFTLLGVFYRFYEELRARPTQKNVVHRVEAGDADSQDFTHKTT
ncbi:uncharacterized protein LOC119445194 [Dermacentor silvarum]|uniref:uncharacterized protein LOC119445194 n=1 Tax=Dermacentor silvarum TaxID=543639 RepID=UPI002100A550|nr:uncharacterized protein LOC119445194 [Dermacentor silvarum]